MLETLGSLNPKTLALLKLYICLALRIYNDIFKIFKSLNYNIVGQLLNLLMGAIICQNSKTLDCLLKLKFKSILCYPTFFFYNYLCSKVKEFRS